MPVQIANIHWIIEKAREIQKNIYFCFIDNTKAFDCVDHNKLWKILQEMVIPDHLTCLLRSPLLIAALFTIANAWTQSKHSSADECMKTWYICAMEHCLSHEKNKMPFVAIWMELDIIILCEVN